MSMIVTEYETLKDGAAPGWVVLSVALAQVMAARPSYTEEEALDVMRAAMVDGTLRFATVEGTQS